MICGTLIALTLLAPVRVGLERVEADGGRPLRGRKIGLVAHAASVTSDGRHAVDVLKSVGVEIVRLFAPEHGIRGSLAAGQPVPENQETEEGIPIVSLYGEKTQPSPDDLEGLDALVFDLQDAGVRFYTYESTMILCLQAAAKAGIEFVVLDRPNPLGGDRIEGPVSEPRDAVPASFVNLAPGPLVHGMTLGEMARYVNARLDPPAELTVVKMDGWERSMTWEDTGRPWVPPSPNLRSPEAALAYPGVAMLEATNVSEGRGTESPFLLLGAPWLRTHLVLARVSVPGFELRATSFTPQVSAAATAPKFAEIPCAGVQVSVTDPHAARPYALGIALLQALRWQPEFEWRPSGAALTRLLGTRRVYEALRLSASADAILRADQGDQAAWRKERKKSLLY